MAESGDRRSSSRSQASRLYVQHSEELLAFFRAMLPMAKVDAKDLLQQTFIELLKWLDGNPTRLIEQPRGLLFKIAHRRVRAYRDRLVRTPSAPAPGEPEIESLARQDDLEYLASLHEGRRGVLRAIRRLDTTNTESLVSDRQLAVYLRFFAGMTETEVGEILDSPRATIAGLLRRTRKELRRQLARLEANEPGRVRTSTTMLERWWQQVEARADEMALTEPEPTPHAKGISL